MQFILVSFVYSKTDFKHVSLFRIHVVDSKTHGIFFTSNKADIESVQNLSMKKEIVKAMIILVSEKEHPSSMNLQPREALSMSMRRGDARVADEIGSKRRGRKWILL